MSHNQKFTQSAHLYIVITKVILRRQPQYSEDAVAVCRNRCCLFLRSATLLKLTSGNDHSVAEQRTVYCTTSARNETVVTICDSDIVLEDSFKNGNGRVF